MAEVNSQIEDHFEQVEDLVADPEFTRRKGSAHKRHRDLWWATCAVFERLLRVSSNESTIYYAETNITLQDGVEYYRLPGNFRRFIAFEKRVSSDPNKVSARYGTASEGSRQPGVIILDAQGYFRLRPVPTLSANETWVLRYNKRPILQHWGTFKVEDITASSDDGSIIEIAHDIPGVQGVVQLSDDYYKAALFHIISDSGVGAGIPWTSEVVSWDGSERKLTLRDTVPTSEDRPTGDIKYEFRSFLPPGYDDVLAIKVAMRLSTGRVNFDRWGMLRREHKEAWAAAKNWFRETTTDRGSPMPVKPTLELEPYDEQYATGAY